MPSRGAGTSMVALSLSSVISGSSVLTASPGFTWISMIGTSLKSPMSGTWISLVAATSGLSPLTPAVAAAGSSSTLQARLTPSTAPASPGRSRTS